MRGLNVKLIKIRQITLLKTFFSVFILNLAFIKFNKYVKLTLGLTSLSKQDNDIEYKRQKYM